MDAPEDFCCWKCRVLVERVRTELFTIFAEGLQREHALRAELRTMDRRCRDLEKRLRHYEPEETKS